MLVTQLTISNYPVVNLFDKVSLALQFMEDYEVQHLPVENQEKYVGLISKDDLLDADDSATLAALEFQLIKVSVSPNEHFLSALNVLVNLGLTLLPVVNTQKELQGVILQKELLKAAAHFNGVEDPGAIIVLEMEKINFAFGELSRLVETNDASIVQLNTNVEAGTGQFLVTIKVNKMEISDILSTFQRYDYTIRYYFGEESYENELKENYDLLMTYLKI